MSYLVLAVAVLLFAVVVGAAWLTRHRPFLGVACVALVLAGCASRDPGVLVLAPEGLCLPSDTPADVLGWAVVSARQIRVTNEGGGPDGATMVFHRRGERVIQVVWIRGEVAVVDLHPEDPQAPAWVNRRLMSGAKVKADAPSGPCLWHHTGEETI